ncbi:MULTISPECIES: DUF1062 domain-containing protein [unclassified Ensifer]|uniref:DUF1062 domain-containing protein n=1 Tax=unclassified Ensifer TaxID=2633371 RepID=UPI0009F19054|nr:MULTISPECIES: DUF1062 domain-containing protein [unclassified Ensifer]
MSYTLTVHWTIEPQTAPRPWRACSRCRGQRPFVCSGKTRLNANGRRLDAWLIYRCADCADTWNRPIFERKNVREVDPDTLHALQNNDLAWIRRTAFDVEDLRRSTDRIEEFPECRVRRRVRARPFEGCNRLEIVLAVAMATSMRADRLLAAELGVSRSRLARLAAMDRLILQPETRKNLQRSIRDGTRIMLDLSAEADRAEIIERAQEGAPSG